MPAQRADFAARLAGSSDLFDRQARRPWASINYVASHDGFTLADVVSYAERHNEANGEDNKDGHGENYSANWGVEGTDRRSAILEHQTARAASDARHAYSWRTARRCCWAATSSAARSAATTTPIARTTRSPGSTGSMLETAPRAASCTAFVGRIIALRHDMPCCARAISCTAGAKLAPGIFDIAWFEAHGEMVSNDSWNNPEERACSCCGARAATTTARCRS